MNEPTPRQSLGPPADTSITVATVEDRREIREGLSILIDGTAGFRCVGRYRSMEQAIEGFARAAPDVALLDIDLPGMSGIEGARRVKERWPRTTIVMLTIYEDDERVFDALCAGAVGYLLKKTPPARLLDSIREAHAGGSPMSPEVARRVVDVFRKSRPPEKADYRLTPHELRLLGFIAEGHSLRTAAAEFGVTVHGITFHMRNIYEKLHVHSRTAAVAKALKEGLLS